MSNLIECIDCGNQVSKRAESCPKCGAPVDVEISKNDPNKNLIIVIVFIAGLFLFLAWAMFNTDTGIKMWNSEYRECREFLSVSLCYKYHG